MQLYSFRYKIKPWSKTIKKRRIKWYGHLLRLDSRTPARQALVEARKKVKKPRGGQKLTWLKLIDSDLTALGIDPKIEVVEVKAQDRLEWNRLANRAMS